MKKNAKLFDLESGHQVLISKDWDDEHECDQINQTTWMGNDGMKVSINVSGFESHKEFNKAFDQYDEAKATNFFNTVKPFFE